MAEPARSAREFLYDQDFFAWVEKQARLLKTRSTAGLDWDNLAEEIETLGRSERSEIRTRMIVLLQHLLKWHYQPEKRKSGWEASIIEARDQINQQLNDSPSLSAYPASVLDKQYRIARLRAVDETNLPDVTFPAQCPYSVGEILDENFYPGRNP